MRQRVLSESFNIGSKYLSELKVKYKKIKNTFESEKKSQNAFENFPIMNYKVIKSHMQKPTCRKIHFLC
jgi:hypothetical protein